jgi:4'-phosphopantetheinyl transferase
MTIDPPPIALSSAEIHLWLASDQVAAETAARCRRLLSVDEREREARFHFAKDRARHLVTRALVRTVLSRYEAVDPADWVFSTNTYGRPDIDASMTRGHDLSFNVSHTAGLIVLGVTRGRALGVDVETLRSLDDLLGLAEHAFAPIEVAELAGLPPERRLDRFFEHWTFKESYIKARGMGVSIPLQGFSIRLTRDGLANLDIAPELSDDSSRWQLWQIRPAPDYLLAICAERIQQKSPAIVARRVVLLDGEEIIPVQFDRVSP